MAWMDGESQLGHIDLIKQLNAGAVYRLIDKHGPISRIDLSRLAQLAPGSITKIVREMVDAQLLQEFESPGPGARGRPAVGLKLETQSWHFLSLHISQGQLRLSLRDLSSYCLVEDEIDFQPTDNQHFIKCLFDAVDAFFVRHQAKIERLTAITLTLPGIVDAAQGIIQHLAGYPVYHLPIVEILSSRIGVAVFVQQDISAWVLAESLLGAASGCGDVIQIVIDSHVQAGIISGGRLLHGASLTLPEVGHFHVSGAGDMCTCGNKGCLETLASLPSILHIAQQRLASVKSESAFQTQVTFDAFCAASLRGEQYALTIIQETADYIGAALAVLVNIFNPSKILIGSPLNELKTLFYPAIMHKICAQALPRYSQNLIIESTHFKQQGSVAGAGLIKDALYNGSLLVRLLQG